MTDTRDHKDRLGDRLRKKEKAEEERYFAELDRKAVERLRADRTKSDAPDPTCPRCGKTLVEQDRSGVMVDICPAECGLWLDAGELSLLAERERDSWLTRMIRLGK